MPAPLLPGDLVWLAPLAALLAAWQLACAVALILGVRVSPSVAFAPTGAVLALAAARVLWTGTLVPWDLATLGAADRIAAAAPDARVKLALAPMLLPGLGVAVAGAALAGPLRGPRALWAAGIAVLYGGLGSLAISVSSALDLAPVGGGLVALGLLPGGMLCAVAQARGRPDGSGPEAAGVGAIAFAHAVAAVAIGTLAESRFAGVHSPLSQDGVAWRQPGFALAWLAAVGVVALALTGLTTDRERAWGAAFGAGTLLLWVPIALFGSLPSLS